MHQTDGQLLRVLGVPAAVLLGLGAVIGTGIFVSIGLAGGVAGTLVLPAITIAALVAACNGLSSAQLAAVHPVSGGTYEYGYRYLNSWLGFQAGWLFLIAKSASAAAAALGFAGYLRAITGIGDSWQVPIALTLVGILTTVVLLGMRASSRVNAVLVLVSVGALLVFVAAILPFAHDRGFPNMNVLPSDADSGRDMMHAAALMFVAFTGYGRVATLGEEVLEPRRTIPRAILWTVSCTFILYVIVAAVAIGASDSGMLRDAADSGLPLSWVADQAGRPIVADIVAFGALVALAGVLLNLLLGLSRVVLAMARRGDMPHNLARLNAGSSSAPLAVVVVGLLIALIVLPGSINVAWSFSAFTVLLYYAITNLAALRVGDTKRFVPRPVAIIGLAGCIGLAWFVPMYIWLPGTGILLAGVAWHAVARSFRVAHAR